LRFEFELSFTYGLSLNLTDVDFIGLKSAHTYTCPCP